ncbi:MAG TPA: hypothetical protein VM187_16475, partial [Niastella sp.]|nr:hypothetical protein [Niastella sp.]
MNDHKEHISQYSAADIQRYVQGKLSAAEMHAMEKAALDDPFLADAMEGMQQAFTEHKESIVTGQLQQLQQQFNTRSNRTAKVIAFKPFRYWQAAAAAAVVLIITGVWLFSLNRDSAAEKQAAAVIAKTEERPLPQQKEAPSVADANNTGIDKDSPTTRGVTVNTHQWQRNEKIVTENKEAPAPKVQVPDKSSASTDGISNAATDRQLNSADKNFPQKEKKEAVAEKNREPAPAVAAAPIQGKTLRFDDENAKEREVETELITIAKSDVKLRKAATKDKNLSGFIKGQVTDPFNHPVAN